MSYRRPANPAPAYWHLLKALPVLGVFWLVTLGLIPALIVKLEHAAKLDDVVFTRHDVAGLVVLGIGTLLVIWAVVTFAVAGGGTPMSFDAPRRMVITGPYAWVRNPMTIGWVIQGTGVAFWSGSVLVLVVFFLAAIWWNYMVRPGDEDELQKAFGRELELYRRHVRCWLPRRRWSPPPHTGPISLDDLIDHRPGRRRH